MLSIPTAYHTGGVLQPRAWNFSKSNSLFIEGQNEDSCRSVLRLQFQWGSYCRSKVFYAIEFLIFFQVFSLVRLDQVYKYSDRFTRRFFIRKKSPTFDLLRTCFRHESSPSRIILHESEKQFFTSLQSENENQRFVNIIKEFLEFFRVKKAAQNSDQPEIEIANFTSLTR